MILYVHSKFLPLQTFVVTVEASWTVRRVRGAILHNLAEIGHHRHPFRLRYNDQYLQDRLTLYESKIYDNKAVELVPLATHAELQSDLFWRYVPNRTKNDEPHLKALQAEIALFNQREKLLRNVKLSLMTLYPLVILTFFVEEFWYWAFVSVLYSSFWIYWCPGYTYLSGWVGKAQIYQKYVKFFLGLGICSLLVFGGTLALTLVSTSAYNYVIFGLTAVVQFVVFGLTVWLLKNVKVEPGVLIEHSLSKFQTAAGLEDAIRSSNTAQQRAAAFELATMAALGESEKYNIVDRDLLDPLNNLCMSPDRYTQEHATEAVAELLTLPSVQDHYFARCNLSVLSSVVVTSSSPQARLEALNALSYLAEDQGDKMDSVGTDLIAAIENGSYNMSEREYALITSILLSIARSSQTIDTFNMASGLAKILSDCSNDDIQRAALQSLYIISKHDQFRCALPVIDELFAIQLRTFDTVSIRLATESLSTVSQTEENAELFLDDAIYQILFDWFRSVLSQGDEAIADAAYVIHNIVSHQILRNRCFNIGFEAEVQILLDSNAILKPVKRSLLQSLSTLELERIQINREMSNTFASRAQSPSSILSPTMVNPETLSQGSMVNPDSLSQGA